MSSTAETRFLLESLIKNRRLLLEMTRRDVSDRYAGQVLGSLWAVVHPVVTVLVFIYIFAVVFRVKVDSNLNIPGDHTLYMVSGIIPWLVIADVLGRGSSIISSQASLVKQVVFPVEILPVKVVLASLPTFIVGMVGLVIYALLSDRATPALLLYPLAAVPLYLFLIGVAFFLSAIGVFVRDIKEFVQMYTLVGIYIAPIFYFIDWLPSKIIPLIYLNPVTSFIEVFHDAAYYGGVRNWCVVVATFLIGAFTAWFGMMVFAKLKPYFGSYL